MTQQVGEGKVGQPPARPVSLKRHFNDTGLANDTNSDQSHMAVCAEG